MGVLLNVNGLVVPPLVVIVGMADGVVPPLPNVNGLVVVISGTGLGTGPGMVPVPVPVSVPVPPSMVAPASRLTVAPIAAGLRNSGLYEGENLKALALALALAPLSLNW